MYKEFHGTKLLIFIIFMNVFAGVLAWANIVPDATVGWVLAWSLGLGQGDTLLKKHEQNIREELERLRQLEKEMDDKSAE